MLSARCNIFSILKTLFGEKGNQGPNFNFLLSKIEGKGETSHLIDQERSL